MANELENGQPDISEEVVVEIVEVKEPNPKELKRQKEPINVGVKVDKIDPGHKRRDFRN